MRHVLTTRWQLYQLDFRSFPDEKLSDNGKKTAWNVEEEKQRQLVRKWHHYYYQD